MINSIGFETILKSQTECVPVLPTDILISIFQHVVRTFEDSITLSLVCKKWSQIMLEDANLWENIFFNIGFPFFSSRDFPTKSAFIQAGRSRFRQETSPWLMERARACTKPSGEVLGIHMELLQECNVIKFLDDTHVIGYNNYEMSVIDISKPNSYQFIQTKSKIQSLCAFKGKVYYALDTREIFSFSVDFLQRETLLRPQQILFGAYADDLKEVQDLDCMLYANSQWLVCVSSYGLQKWERESGELMGKLSFCFSMQHFQLNWNNLYWTESSCNSDWSLFCWNLNADRIQKYELVSGIEALHKIHVSGTRCSFIVQTELPECEMESESSEDSYIGKKLSIINLDLNANKRTVCDINSIGYDENPVLLLSNGLTLFGRSAQGPDCVRDDDAAPLPEILELRSLEGEIVHRLPNFDQIHGAHSIWSITFFHNMLFYVTDKNVMRITFAERHNKRQGEVDLQGDAKRRKIVGSPSI